MNRITLGLLALVMVAAACGGAGDNTVTGGAEEASLASSEDGPAPSSGGGELPFGLRRCTPDVARVSADPELYREDPVYVANEMPTDVVRAWAVGRPGFEDIWIDRAHNGWITVAFSEDADRRQAELVEAFPGVGVVAVAVDWTESDLVKLRDDAFAAMREAGFETGGGHSVSRGVVSVWVGELSEERLAPLAALAGSRLCVDGVELEDVVRQGPQPTEGDGWRLLGTERTGPTYRTGVATTDKQYEILWVASGLSIQRPEVDFGNEIVIWFGAVYGSGCQIRMDDVVFDSERSIVYAEFVIPGSPQTCNADANPEAYVVTVERDRLPEGRFAIQLGADDPPKGTPEERTVVDADLRAPGSVASDDQIGIDATLVADAGRGYVITAGGVVEPGFAALYDLDLSCDFELIGPINGVMWASNTPELGANPPELWVEAADGGGILEVEVLLETDPPRLSLSANGHAESYKPAASGTSTCP